jgi:hypothetical protein
VVIEQYFDYPFETMNDELSSFATTTPTTVLPINRINHIAIVHMTTVVYDNTALTGWQDDKAYGRNDKTTRRMTTDIYDNPAKTFGTIFTIMSNT